jgi:general secretion pathway protein J
MTSSATPVRHRRRAAASPPRRHGFTLVELLIALVLIAVITLLMFSGLRVGSRAWEGVETVSERVSDLRVARNFIDRTLRQTRRTSIVFDGQDWPVFAGDPERVELVAPLSEHVGIPGLYVLRLVLESAGDHDRLVLVRWLLHPEVLEGGDDYPAWEPLLESSGIGGDEGPLDRDVAAGAYGRTVLLPEVEVFELAYFGVAEGETEPEWFEEWVGQSRLPQKVRVVVSTPRQSWPAAVLELPSGELDERRRAGGVAVDTGASLAEPDDQSQPGAGARSAPEQQDGR